VSARAHPALFVINADDRHRAGNKHLFAIEGNHILKMVGEALNGSFSRAKARELSAQRIHFEAPDIRRAVKLPVAIGHFEGVPVTQCDFAYPRLHESQGRPGVEAASTNKHRLRGKRGLVKSGDEFLAVRERVFPQAFWCVGCCPIDAGHF